MAIASYTNSSLKTMRECPRKFQLKYVERLELRFDDREALQVGTAWHSAFSFAKEYLDELIENQGSDEGLAEIVKDRTSEFLRSVAPSAIWGEKLVRLWYGYHWHYAQFDAQYTDEIREHAFEVLLGGQPFRGQIDAVTVNASGRRGIRERKTTSDSLEDGSMYWDRLRLDTQVGVYGRAAALDDSLGFQGRPIDFILYDVVRKPTINPKKLIAADIKRLRAELDKASGEAGGVVNYFGYMPVPEMASEIEQALFEGAESLQMYGNRLTADIGNRPEFYFALREVARTTDDFDSLEEDVSGTVSMIETCEAWGFYPRNPDSCSTFGQCEFFALCSNNIPAAAGVDHKLFARREKLHPELPNN
jgi:hypothetical protein